VLTADQDAALAHLRSAYLGPEGGPDELLENPPNLRYSVGMLFPREAPAQVPDEDAGQAVVGADVPTSDLEEDGASVPLAEDWRPSSVAVSFVTDGTSVLCDLSGATYVDVRGDGPPAWRRQPFEVRAVELTDAQPPIEITIGGVPAEIGARWRPFGDARLVTVHARVTSTSLGDDRLDVPLTLFQVGLSVAAAPNHTFLEYDTKRAFDVDQESAELRLRYRKRKVYAVGHGMSADWQLEDGVCTRVTLEPVPAFVVPAVEVTGFDPGTAEYEALELGHLARIDSTPKPVLTSLDAFLTAFSDWVATEELRVESFGPDAPVARRIVARSRSTVERMSEGIQLLRSPENDQLRTAFALAMAAMRLQMLQAAKQRGADPEEPRWRPFQLGFLLVALASTLDDTHPERDLVDLIWFPTGGGKTEAYLALAATEIFRRRIQHGTGGAGTAVITRYTLRLLTAQQFQRTASLICAMELLRRPGPLNDPRARGMSPFSIGLWVGNQVTPGTRAEAKAALDRLHKALRPDEANQFQIESCPWCGAALLPRARSSDRGLYGMRLAGRDTIIHCTDTSCPFGEELPVAVVDEVIYDDPPTIVLATVDKFARLQFRPEAGRLLGLGTPFRQPSLIIQDELHLLSGPLGTTVAVFDAVIQVLLTRTGSVPKIVASTATIRASAEQVAGLYGREVALYPPAGLDDDQTFFSRPIATAEGRLYVGLMPQSTSQASALVAAAAPLLELPGALAASPASSGAKDAYWTTVMYHNSLRELGRSGALVADDVSARLEARSARMHLQPRTIRADRVVELTSRQEAEELPKLLKALSQSADETDEAVDVVLSSNMLSVGIDVQRLGLMLMVGQPKTTAEYIQATSRVGRGRVRGIVVTLFRSNRARDRSHFETFTSYHEALYRSVEPTSVTPWSLSSRARSLGGALVAMLRQSISGLEKNDSAIDFDLEDAPMTAAVETVVSELLGVVRRSEPAEADETADELRALLRDWDRRAAAARASGTALLYDRHKPDDQALLRRFGQQGEGWLVADSMRSVEPNVAVEVREPMEEVARGTHPA
jgi:hypothetical protein